MTINLSALGDPSIWFGTGGAGILGFMSGHVKLRNSRVAALEKEVKECRERDAHIVVLTACFRTLWGEQMRKDPTNPVLRMCGDLIAKKLPVTAEERKLEGLGDLISQLDKIDYVRESSNG